MKRRMVRLLTLAIALMLVFASVMPAFAGKSIVTNADAEKKYDIAVVYDNSGSMYENSTRWCQAKYAMEIFASMLSYENGDRLTIFPMWEVTTDTSRPLQGQGGSYEPFEVKSKSDIDKISNMFTVRPSFTPFEPVFDAEKYLLSSKAGEKWLIVMTDGEFLCYARKKADENNDYQKDFERIASEGIKVQYFGFGDAGESKSSTFSSKESIGFFVKNSNDNSIREDLIDICNRIFQRSVLPGVEKDGGKLRLDLSMKKLIVFVQGKGAKINSLKDENGNEVKKLLDSGQRKYSTIGSNLTNTITEIKWDESLAGQVVTFDSCKKGAYTLDCSGAQSVQVFYEPDVDIQVALTNSEGQLVDTSGKALTPGEYTVKSTLIDAVTGDDVTGNSLLGGVTMSVKVKKGTESDYKEYENGAKIDFAADETMDMYIEGRYLEKYTISTKDDPRFSWMRSAKVASDPINLGVSAEVMQSQNWYTLKDHAQWQPIKVTLSVDGMPLNEQKFKDVNFEPVFSGSLQYSIKAAPEESAYYIYIATDKDGNYTEPSTGGYTMEAKATYTDEYGTQSSASDKVGFDIQSYGKFWRWLKWVMIVLAIAAVILFIMSRKVLPKKIYSGERSFVVKSKEIGPGKFGYSKKQRVISLKSEKVPSRPEAECRITLKLYPVDRRWTKSRNRRIGISDITGASQGVTSVIISGTEYEKQNGKFVLPNNPNAPIKKEVKRPQVMMSTDCSYFEVSILES